MCDSVYTARFGMRPGIEDACFALAVSVVDMLTADLYVNVDSAISPRDLQQTNSGDAATSGSVAQGEVVPTAQPMAIGGGSVAATGSDAGTSAITALTINPAIFFTSSEARETIAKWSRLTDATVFFPVDGLDQNDDGEIDYFGVRLRVNMTGLSAGGRIMQQAREKFLGLLEIEARNARRLADLLEAAPELEACITALTGVASAQSRVRACGADFRIQLDPSQYEAFRRNLTSIRERADARYLGFDLRLDVGDPTLGAVPDAAATAITSGLAFGQQFVGKDALAASFGVKGRLGVHFSDLHDIDETHFALDGGLAFEARRLVEPQRPILLAGGFEFRYGNAEQFRSELQTDFLVFRASLNVPLANVAGVSVNVRAPLIGESISPTLSVNVNWGVLLPKLGLP